jgi:cbb3-type cytochrome oxidase subunit 3
LKYKAEVCTLLIAICLFAVSAFFYSYATQDEANAETQAVFSLNAATYPYRGYGLASVAFGAVFMTTAAISYSKRSENGFENLFVLAKNKADEKPN